MSDPTFQHVEQAADEAAGAVLADDFLVADLAGSQLLAWDVTQTVGFALLTPEAQAEVLRAA